MATETQNKTEGRREDAKRPSTAPCYSAQVEAVKAFGRGAQRIGTQRIMEIVKLHMPHVDDRYASDVAGRFHALPSGFANTFNGDVAEHLIRECIEAGENGELIDPFTKFEEELAEKQQEINELKAYVERLRDLVHWLLDEHEIPASDYIKTELLASKAQSLNHILSQVEEETIAIAEKYVGFTLKYMPRKYSAAPSNRDV